MRRFPEAATTCPLWKNSWNSAKKNAGSTTRQFELISLRLAAESPSRGEQLAKSASLGGKSNAG